MPERGRSELNFVRWSLAPGRPMYASPEAAAKMKCSERDECALPQYGSGRHVVDHNIDEPVVADAIRDFAERIATARERIA